jgi:GlpG protein
MEGYSDQPADGNYKRYIPVVTAMCCLISIVLFVGVNMETLPYSWASMERWGAAVMTPDRITPFWWQLITSNFLHVDIGHLIFNLYWLWIFGKKMEREGKLPSYLVFILSAALVSSLTMLAFVSETGIGLSGIVYAQFGYLWVKSATAGRYENYLSRRTIHIFLLWLLLCFALSSFGIWNVGNAAHLGGMLWGAFLAWLSRYRLPIRWAAATSTMALLVVFLIYSPFSTTYLSYKAFQLHQQQRVEEAVIEYRRILKRDPDNEFATQNLKQLEIYQLEKKAFTYHNNHQYAQARLVYSQILQLDSNDKWAKENLMLLSDN